VIEQIGRGPLVPERLALELLGRIDATAPLVPRVLAADAFEAITEGSGLLPALRARWSDEDRAMRPYRAFA
jgi:hypothetical protein